MQVLELTERPPLNGEVRQCLYFDDGYAGKLWLTKIEKPRRPEKDLSDHTHTCMTGILTYLCLM